MALERAVPTYTARQVHYTCPIHPRDRAGGASNQIGRNVVASQTEITFTSLAAFAEQRAGARLALRKRTTGRYQQGNTERRPTRPEEHTSELQSLLRLTYADFCFKKNN